jgi:cell division transport system ATP-binding protein
MIDVQSLSHSFGTRQVLGDVSLSLGRGGFLFLTGRSGSGKSTLLRILHGSLPLQEGWATIAGFDLARLGARHVPRLRREVAMIFQDFRILPDRTLFDNVALALEVRSLPRAEIDRKVRAALRAVRLDGLADAPCSCLSGGEQQRAAIARAVAATPQVLLADEPTGNLDRDSALRLVDLLRLLHSRGTTVVMATHNTDLIARVPEAAVLHLDDRPGPADTLAGAPADATPAGPLAFPPSMLRKAGPDAARPGTSAEPATPAQGRTSVGAGKAHGADGRPDSRTDSRTDFRTGGRPDGQPDRRPARQPGGDGPSEDFRFDSPLNGEFRPGPAKLAAVKAGASTQGASGPSSPGPGASTLGPSGPGASTSSASGPDASGPDATGPAVAVAGPSRPGDARPAAPGKVA